MFSTRVPLTTCVTACGSSGRIAGLISGKMKCVNSATPGWFHTYETRDPKAYVEGPVGKSTRAGITRKRCQRGAKGALVRIEPKRRCRGSATRVVCRNRASGQADPPSAPDRMLHYSDTRSPEPPSSAGKSLILGRPSRIGRTALGCSATGKAPLLRHAHLQRIHYASL